MAAERSGERGFGYDPVFVPAGEARGRTMADSPTPRRTRSRTAGTPPAPCSRTCADASAEPRASIGTDVEGPLGDSLPDGPRRQRRDVSAG